MSRFGCMVLRGSPIHAGHQAVLKKMIEDHGIENCRAFLGSAGHELSMRHLFTYEQRASFIQAVYPELVVMPLADFPTDQEWFKALDDLLIGSRFDPSGVVFYGGCQEDIRFFLEDGRKYEILNRFDGTTPEISATKIRDFLIAGKSIADWIDPRIVDMVEREFAKNWAILRTR